MIIKNGSYTVYAHINKINGKMYIGITSLALEKRWRKGKAYNENTHLYKAFIKYGWDNFDHEIIASNLTQEEAFCMEKILIKNLDLTNSNKGYNMIDGGSMPPHHKGKDHPNYGKSLSLEIRNKISKAKAAKSQGPHTEETKRKISEAHKGKPHPCSEPRKQKVSERMSGSKNPKAKKVVCVELGLIFDTAREASAFIGKSKSAVSTAIYKNVKTGGYTWKYL